MKAAFVLFGNDPLAFIFADRLVRSIRDTMPGVEIIQLTDEKTPRVVGVDDCYRQPKAKLTILRNNHYARLDGEWLLIDTDAIVQQDVRHVFEEDFDIALTDRNWPHLPELSKEFTDQMPYCTGLIFSRCRRFWEEVYAQALTIPADSPDLNSGYADQRIIAQLVRSGQYRFHELPGAIYQYPPLNQDDDLNTAAIVHYKGNRKTFLLNRIHRELFA